MSQRTLLASIVAIGVLAGCQNGPTKEELEAAKNTIDCERPGERIVIRFAEGVRFRSAAATPPSRAILQ